ncbi:MAG: two-component system, NarL family, nitrate/nitrite response regulator NarL [Solirubrobacteraceae bacterium]|nr:two-component system, NarL family, nitrate/nitrite response regulator NarL [Solirubrobacteraceae bacterium]
MPGVRVLVADDHPIFREGVARAVSNRDGLEVVAQCDRGDDALERIREVRPDVAVIDYRMPGLDADGVLAGLNAAGSDTRVLVLSAVTEPDHVLAVLERGAAGYLNKDSDRSVIVEAVERIAAGGTVMGADAQSAMLSRVRAGARHGSVLTDRETEVLALLAEGLSAPTIARRLVVEPSTVKSHLKNLYGKLGVSDRAAAVAEGMRRGLVD